jgi:serine phosphatase RsbU (regulator of sigma subunit)
METLQTAFLPARLPRRAGLRCDALYIAAEREALIGGDWYDAFELPDGRIVLSIGDVTGHGLDAAVSAAQLRRNILVAAFETGEPANILARTADALQSELEISATALVAIVSQDLATLSYASAGHPPGILASPTIPARMLEYGGVPIGSGIPIASQTRTVALERGAVLLLYTDGLVEFSRDILGAEAAALNAVSQLVGNAQIEHPAAFVQRCVMGSRQATDDTVLLVAQLDTL